MIVQDSHPPRGVYLDVDDRLEYVLELEPPFAFVVRASLMPFSLGLLADLAFRRDFRLVLSSEIAILSAGGGRSAAAEAALVLGGGRPDEIFVPASVFDPTRRGEWIEVPEGSVRAFLTLGEGLDFE